MAVYAKALDREACANLRPPSVVADGRKLSAEQNKSALKARSIGAEMAWCAVDFIRLNAIHDVSPTKNTKLARDLFVKWFKEVKHTKTVENNFISLGGALLNNPIIFCSALEGDYKNYANLFAITVAGDGKTPTTLYAGPRFWRASESGYDSRPGVLIHELAHSIWKAEDKGYGVEGCLALSESDAIKNADSYEYFAENALVLQKDLEHLSSVNLSGYWEELTIRETPCFASVRDWYEIKQDNKKITATATIHDGQITGIISGSDLKYTDGANQFVCKTIHADMIQGRFSANPGITGSVFLTRIRTPELGRNIPQGRIACGKSQ